MAEGDAEMMKEVLPGLFHWYVVWPEYRLECYWLRTEEGSVLIDPLEGIGLDEIEQAGDCRAVIITSDWHERSALLFAKRTGAPIYVPEGHTDRLELVETYHTYHDGDTLPGGLTGYLGVGRMRIVCRSYTAGRCSWEMRWERPGSGRPAAFRWACIREGCRPEQR